MIDALIAGKLHGKPQERTGKSGRPFVTARVRTPAGEETVFVSVIAFADDVCRSLLALDDGDSVSLSGALTPKAWTDKNGDARPSLDLVAHAVLSVYHIQRKRRAMTKDGNHPSQSRDEFADDVPNF